MSQHVRGHNHPRGAGSPRGGGIADYGVLRGTPLRQGVFRPANPHNQPHLHILVDSGEEQNDVTVDVFSQERSEVRFLIVPNFVPGRANDLIALNPGSTPIQPGQPDGIGLDYIRQRLFSPDEMNLLPIDPNQLNDDLHNALSDLIGQAIEARADLYAFGSLFDDSNGGRGPNPFNIDPDVGIHNIHMNQGNPPGNHDGDNGTFQDGGLLVHFTGDQDSWTAVFLAFQSQSFASDDSGDPA